MTRSPEQPEPARLTRMLSHVMDELVEIPGTKVRVGADPVLSLIPWAGTAAGALFGAAILFDAIKLRAPVTVLARMASNILLDWALGTIPFLGAVFDVAFRSNKRNLALLRRTIEDKELVRKASVRYWAGAGLIAVLLLVSVIAIPVGLFIGLAQLLSHQP